MVPIVPNGETETYSNLSLHESRPNHCYSSTRLILPKSQTRVILPELFFQTKLILPRAQLHRLSRTESVPVERRVGRGRAQVRSPRALGTALKMALCDAGRQAYGRVDGNLREVGYPTAQILICANLGFQRLKYANLPNGELGVWTSQAAPSLRPSASAGNRCRLWPRIVSCWTVSASMAGSCYR